MFLHLVFLDVEMLNAKIQNMKKFLLHPPADPGKEVNEIPLNLL